MVNEVILIGRVNAQPTLKYWEKDDRAVPIARFTLETNGSSTDIHEIVMFGEGAEKLISEKAVEEGDMVLVKGKLKSKINEKYRVHEVYAFQVERVS